MKLIPLTNISNKDRTLYLFCRDKQGNLIIDKDESFLPYFYEPHDEGDCKSYDGKLLKKIFVSFPSDVPKRRSNNSYESDIIFTKRYLIDRVDKIEKTNIKYSFIDTEMLADRFPSPELAEYPFSVISSHNSYTGKITTFYLDNYANEEQMIDDFIVYLNREKFDLLLFWNGDRFDMPYLLKRIDKFPEKISPIKQARYGTNGMLYPAGISIVDFMLVDKKITLNRKKEYSLEARANEVLGKSRKVKDIDFSKLSPKLVERCENDVKDMIDMEKKLNYIPLLDSLRRLTKTEFEDYVFNSRYIDQLLLKHGKRKNIILPKKKNKEDIIEVEGFEGAFREVYKKGRVFNCGAYDIGGAYLNSIIELNLDPANIREIEEENTIPVKLTDRKTNEIIKTYYVKQTEDCLLPSVAKELLDSKNKYKELKNSTPPTDPNYKNIKEIYEAYKSISLSAWGTIGNKYFRYYDSITSSLITSVPRDLLHYVKDNLEEKGYSIIFIDTDGIVIDDKGKNISKYLNELVEDWSIENFGKAININFEYEGNYEKLFVKANCHYKGFLRTEMGLETKIKGIEAKRKNSTNFIRTFQDNLIDYVLDKHSEKETIDWIKEHIDNFKEHPLQDIAFPCKLSKEVYEKNTPIWVRALNNTKNFDVKVGEIYYYIYVIPQEEFKIKTVIKIKGNLKETNGISHQDIILDENLTRKEGIEYAKKQWKQPELDGKLISVLHQKDRPKDVIAFNEKNNTHITKEIIDWYEMIRLNIVSKSEAIFEAMNWDLTPVLTLMPKKPLKQPKRALKSPQNKPVSNEKRDIETMYPPKIEEKESKSTQPIENKEDTDKIKEIKPKIEPYYFED